MKCDKKNENRVAEMHFVSSPTEKMIREWRGQEEGLKK
jgi:hypothetical protein